MNGVFFWLVDIFAKHPEKVREIEKLYDSWLDQMAEPASGDPKRFGDGSAGKDKAKKKTERAKRKALRSDK